MNIHIPCSIVETLIFIVILIISTALVHGGWLLFYRIRFRDIGKIKNVEISIPAINNSIPKQSSIKKPNRTEFAFQLGLDVQSYKEAFHKIRNEDDKKKIIQEYDDAKQSFKIIFEKRKLINSVLRSAETIESLINEMSSKFSWYGIALNNFMVIKQAMQEQFQLGLSISEQQRIDMEKELSILWGVDKNSTRIQMIELINKLAEIIRKESDDGF